jgi:predicted dithiol-disulfide oxidoreductase (DUF899 family)
MHLSSWEEKIPDIEQRMALAAVARSPIDRLVAAEDADDPAYNVYPRGAPDLDPLWSILDTAPEGRGADWYPKLEYKSGK